MIKLNDKVRISVASEYYNPTDEDSTNPNGIDGIVISTTEDYLPIKVLWENDRKNTYDENDLIVQGN